MSQFTIRKIPEKLEKELRTLAHQKKSSLNKTIISLLQKALGIPDSENKHRNLTDLSGTWDQTQAEAFTKNTQNVKKTDGEILET